MYNPENKDIHHGTAYIGLDYDVPGPAQPGYTPQENDVDWAVEEDSVDAVNHFFAD